MFSISPFLKSLISAPGISAHEAPVRQIVEEKWRPLVDDLSLSRLGSLHGLKRGRAQPPRPSLVLLAHMDAIGLVVTQIVDGFLSLASIGGIDPRILPGTPVTVHATGNGIKELPGLVVQPAASLLPDSIGNGPVPLKHLFVDTGLPPRQVTELVQVGDLVAFATEPVELAAETISGHSLDNRASVAALTVCLEHLQGRAHDWDMWAIATVREEVGLHGAATSTFQIQPGLAVAIDVTFGKGPGASDWQTVALNSGPALGLGPNIHPALHKRFKELAEKLEIPFSVEVMPRGSGTDGMAAQVSREGVPTMVISIPLRYMHTPVEVVAYQDIERTGRLLAEFVCSLEVDFTTKMIWNE
jgi:putative aminopeptidase FrvX